MWLSFIIMPSVVTIVPLLLSIKYELPVFKYFEHLRVLGRSTSNTDAYYSKENKNIVSRKTMSSLRIERSTMEFCIYSSLS